MYINFQVIDNIMKQGPRSSRDETEANKELPVPRDPIRETEYNILLLLAQISYRATPGEHLLNQNCLQVLCDYVLHAKTPFPKCGRILQRLSKDPHCLEPLILSLGLSLIHARLGPQNIERVLQEETDRLDSDNSVAKDESGETGEKEKKEEEAVKKVVGERGKKEEAGGTTGAADAAPPRKKLKLDVRATSSEDPLK